MQWSADGVVICNAPGDQFNPYIVSDDSGGAIITWWDNRGGTIYDIYGQRIDSNGVGLWTADGVAIYKAISWDQQDSTAVSDGSGGAIITWMDSREGLDIYAQRINASGDLQWAADGVAVSIAQWAQVFPRIVSDGRGGAIITWSDSRNDPLVYDIYAQRVYANGSLPFTKVTVFTPNGGETIATGSTYEITWGAPAEAVRFTIEYSTNNGVTWQPIASNIEGTSYNFTVPKVTDNKTKCRVKVTGYNAYGRPVGRDVSDGPFTFEVVRVTSPNGGEAWKSSSSHAITWSTNRPISTVAMVGLYYTCNGSTAYNLIKKVMLNPGRYNWTVPSATTTRTGCKVKVELRGYGNVTIGSDISDRNFTIQP